MSNICKNCEKRHSCDPIKRAIYVSPVDNSCPFYEKDTFLSLDDLMNSKIEQVKLDLDVKSLYPSIMPLNPAYGKMTISMNSIPKIKNVIFNNPATIVFWEDGTKTIVKCQDGDVFDPEKGLTMAISKKALGNKGNYCNEIKKWTDKSHE